MSVADIKFFSRVSNKIETEKVYGDKWIHWLYCSVSGKIFSKILAQAFVSRFYGKLQDYSFTRKKIKPFIENYNIDMSEYQHGTLGEDLPKDQSYSCFNDFFIRKFIEKKRIFVQEQNRLAAFSEARYLAFSEVVADQTFPVKGKELSAAAILQNKDWEKVFVGGPLIIARLCPVDYHRFHYPDSGIVLDNYSIAGKLYSVNPLALRAMDTVYSENERRVTILQTENFGKVAYVEVGATMVGKIVQSHNLKMPFKKGDEKGYFLFGASSVLIMGEKGRWLPSQDILERTTEKIETYVQLGDSIAIA